MLEIVPIKSVLHDVFHHFEFCNQGGAGVPLRGGGDGWRTMVLLAGHLALAGHSTLLICCRGSGLEAGQELLANRAGIPAQFLGRINYDAFKRISAAAGKLSTTPLHFLGAAGWAQSARLRAFTTVQFRFIILDSPMTPALEARLPELSMRSRVTWLTPIC